MSPSRFADAHDLLAAERFLAAEARIAATFIRIEERIAPLLRSMRASGRTTYTTDPERGAMWGHAFLRPPYAPDIQAEWFLGWGLRFPDGGTGWEGADPPLPQTLHALVALGACSEPRPQVDRGPPEYLPKGWSVVQGDAASLVATLPLHGLPVEPLIIADTLADWTLARLEELRAILPDLAAA
jgi:hypothetical protein